MSEDNLRQIQDALYRMIHDKDITLDEVRKIAGECYAKIIYINADLEKICRTINNLTL